MIIDIMEKPASHCWVVCMDALEVNFNSLGEARAFVGQLKTRIEAPHAWPISPSPAAVTRPMPDRRTACPKGEQSRADFVE
ncbi:hypothetical protein OH720_15810 [Pseudomonas sp. WJP1]|uniref:hypothetical protein n=1 Tax=Pseudomonas sp. WJP1 TaxID=2986947 RepID=UPI002349CA70|nr:hypothetical protein [Pseudomonas sp. WJP1]WCM48501.1 hypothetical protein OH720_15810 [Pseudomonas sp. WJP1]